MVAAACGRVLDGFPHGLVEHWLAPIRDLFRQHHDELSCLPSEEARADRVCELNVRAQVHSLYHSPVGEKRLGARPGAHHSRLDLSIDRGSLAGPALQPIRPTGGQRRRLTGHEAASARSPDRPVRCQSPSQPLQKHRSLLRGQGTLLRDPARRDSAPTTTPRRRPSRWETVSTNIPKLNHTSTDLEIPLHRHIHQEDPAFVS